MNETNSKRQKIIYYSVLGLMIVLLCVVTIIAIAQSNKNPTIEVPIQSSDSSPDDSSSPPQADVPDTPDEPDVPDVPVVTVVSFILPVEDGRVIKEHTENTVVYSSTLGSYTGHAGMDFAGKENAKVYAAFGGVIKEISTSYLKGTTIVIDHGSGLETHYNSIEPLENLTVGKQVNKGDQIATIAINNKQEYKDGPHLHFEVYENNKLISPLKYLSIEEK